jgi:hypothetical protein
MKGPKPLILTVECPETLNSDDGGSQNAPAPAEHPSPLSARAPPAPCNRFCRPGPYGVSEATQVPALRHPSYPGPCSTTPSCWWQQESARLAFPRPPLGRETSRRNLEISLITENSLGALKIHLGHWKFTPSRLSPMQAPDQWYPLRRFTCTTCAQHPRAAGAHASLRALPKQGQRGVVVLPAQLARWKGPTRPFTATSPATASFRLRQPKKVPREVCMLLHVNRRSPPSLPSLK